jgi:tetratricopeptide (TPR) repeat protein
MSFRELIAKALINNGTSLDRLGRGEEAIAVFDDVIVRLAGSPELPLLEAVVKALLSKGLALGELGRRDEEIALYDDVAARFGSAPELCLRKLVASALVNKGVRLGQLDRSEEAVAVSDEVATRFGSAPEAPLRDLVRQRSPTKKSLSTSSAEAVCRRRVEETVARGSDRASISPNLRVHCRRSW